MSTVVIVLSTEMLAQKPLLGVNAGDQNGNYQRRQQYSHAGPKGKRPSKHIHYQAQIAWVANLVVNAGSDERMPLLNGHQPAEPLAQYENWP